MANSKQLAKLKDGAQRWNVWRKSHTEHVDLAGVDLADAHLSRANLSGVDLSGANLFQTRFRKANLSGANLSGANLTGADLSEANLASANLTYASLGGANLSKATVGLTGFGMVNLSGTLGLETCRHGGPSVIDFTTLAKSGRLPFAFLRGCGLPERLIDYLPSISVDPIQFYSCFISYASKDHDFAQRLYADLQARGVRCWFAPHDMAGGKKIHEQIDEAIRVYDRLLLVLSDHSMKSRWVKTEISNARRKEVAQGRRVLFPVRLVEFESIRRWNLFDGDLGDDSARELREYYVPDFSGWKDHDLYQREFEKLVRDLQAVDGEVAAGARA